MRDIALVLLVTAIGLYAFRKNHLAVLLWAWLSLMNPHRLTFGFAYDLPFAQISAGLVILIFLVSKEKQPFPRDNLAWLLLVWYLWMGVTSLVSFNTPSEVFDYWIKVTKIYAMLFVTLMMLRGRQHIMLLIWVIVLSLGFYGLKGGVHVARGGSMVQGPSGTFIEVSNHLAAALVITVPLMYFLAHEQRSKWVRWGLYGLMAMTVLAVFGTGSRGAFLGVLGMAAFLGLKSRHRVLTIVVGGAVLFGLIAFMPEHWADRMSGISTHEDHSAQSRLYTWQMIWNLALHNPITGGGFVVTENPATWYKYAVTEWLRPYSPHSVYFQVLAEHGFVGIALYLSIWITGWRKCTSLIKRAITPETAWIGHLARMIQPSIIGFLVAGAFVNLAHFDLSLYILLLVVLCDTELKQRERAAAAAPATMPSPMPVVSQTPVAR